MKERSNRFVPYLGIFGLLGFIGLFSFLGFSKGYYIFVNYFMLFFFFIRKGNRTDERWQRNINRAGRNGFFLTVVTLCVSADYVWFVNSFEVLPLLSAVMLP